jgi:hypothetical protein
MWAYRLWIAAAVVAATCFVGWLLYVEGKQAGRAEVQQKWDARTAVIQQAHIKELTKARQTEQTLQDALTQQKQEHRNEVRRITRKHAALVDSLRDRPEARAGDSGVPQGAAAGVGCTGAGLSRPDAGFLIGFAADAARTQAALEQCRAQYAEVERQLNGVASMADSTAP